LNVAYDMWPISQFVRCDRNLFFSIDVQTSRLGLCFVPTKRCTYIANNAVACAISWI
jgi:hypothetical protein